MYGFSVPPNQRSHRRNKISQDAKVIYPDERGFVDVIIRDLSVEGARIQLKSSTDLSGAFDLFIPPEKMRYKASVRWMKGDLVGLRFIRQSENAALKKA